MRCGKNRKRSKKQQQQHKSGMSRIYIVGGAGAVVLFHLKMVYLLAKRSHFLTKAETLTLAVWLQSRWRTVSAVQQRCNHV